MQKCSQDTQFGLLTLTADDGAITSLEWAGGKRHGLNVNGSEAALLREACAQLAAYDRGDLQEFDLPLRPAGSAFQQAVCAAMSRIPFGYTVTYGDIARELDASARAVGAACGGNPIPVIIPCHRVMGAKGLTGFSGAGGVETKVALLRHEGAAGLLI